MAEETPIRAGSRAVKEPPRRTTPGRAHGPLGAGGAGRAGRRGGEGAGQGRACFGPLPPGLSEPACPGQARGDRGMRR